MARARMIAVVFSTFLMGGCAQQILQAAQGECSAFGYTPGTADYANCVQKRYGERWGSIQSGLARMQQSLQPPQNAYGPVSASSSSSISSFGTAYLRGQSVSGTSRICSYDRMGSPYIITVSSVEFCPLSIP